MNEELKIIGNYTAMGSLTEFPPHSPGETEETRDDLTRDNGCHCTGQKLYRLSRRIKLCDRANEDGHRAGHVCPEAANFN
jgi:hypothetical protein